MAPDKKDRQYGPVVAEASSRSDPSKVYQVRCKAGVLSCNCKGWIFNRESPKRCKHTDAVGKSTMVDRAVEIVRSMLRAANLNVMPAAAEVMAGVLRPQLGVVNATAEKVCGGDLVGARVLRRIVLDD